MHYKDISEFEHLDDFENYTLVILLKAVNPSISEEHTFNVLKKYLFTDNELGWGPEIAELAASEILRGKDGGDYH